MNEPLSLYLHIPFCATKCTYCAFNAYAHLDHLVVPFVEALQREVEWVGRSAPQQTVHTVYFGGGTPSLLSPAQLEAVLVTIRQTFAVSLDAEISMEANPDDLSRDYVAGVRAAGINRMSIGMQSANARELTLFDRRHDFATVVGAVDAARDGGCDNLNLDLIFGVPGQTLADWANSLERLLELRPEHVSLYALGLEEGTAMEAWVTSGRLPEVDDDLAADMYEMATDKLGAAGYDQYEISNWCLPGFECRHNVQYWRNWPYLGLGPGAHGFAGGVRYSNILAPGRYIKALEGVEGTSAYPTTPVTAEHTLLDRQTEIAETLLMSLRLLQEGVPRAAFRERFGADVMEERGAVLTRFVQNGLLYADEQVVRLTAQGRFLSNMIFRELV